MGLKYFILYAVPVKGALTLPPCIVLYLITSNFEAGRGAAARGVTAKPTGCGFDPHSRR